MKKILVTGGCGYIGSHTIADLLKHGYDVISVDDNSRSTPASLAGIEKITGKKVKNYPVNLCDLDETEAIFNENPGISGIIHFAAFKAVGESVEHPLLYFKNNLNSLINILQCAADFKVPHFVFSSSCTVYGNPDASCVTENSPILPAASPYGSTKQMGEVIVEQTADRYTNLKAVLLRYFNPAGAHPTNELGELPLGRPQNLVPAITQTAAGKLPQMQVHGTDYDTRDGSCVRDFIHVCDIAHAHTLALEYMMKDKMEKNTETFNLGTGNGVTVLEAINTFEKVTGSSLNYKSGPRRPGDVVAIYANNDKAKTVLGWDPAYDMNHIMETAWAWENKKA